MKLQTVFALIGSFLLIGTLLFFSKKSNTNDCLERINYDNIHLLDDINLDSLFQPADSVELENILKDWKNFDASSESFKVIEEQDYPFQRKLKIVEHFAEGRTHYGGVLFPSNYDESKKYPLLVFLHGLNQIDPSIKVMYSPTSFSGYKDYFIIVPSFRGQALIFKKNKYCSDGFFGDAYDGATDDALRLLELTKKEFAGVDEKRIAVCGGSRGGTVSMLMGIRDTSIHAIAAKTGPVDFFSKEVYDRYRNQYKYQFLSHLKPMNEIREKMIKSSPIYFIENYPNDLLLIYGKKDRIVPISNAEKLIEKLDGKENVETVLLDKGHQIMEEERIERWLLEKN